MRESSKMHDLIRQFCSQIREYHRTHNVVLRNQAIKNLWDVAPRAMMPKLLANCFPGKDASNA